MFNKEKDILTGEETYAGEHTEEYEYYNMEQLEKQLMKKLAIIEEKVDTVLNEVEDNQHRLKDIQFQFTRALIIRLIKLAFIVTIIWYVYNNFVSPVLVTASEKYFQLENTLDRVDAVRNTEDSLLDTAKKLFPNAGSALDNIRPGTEDSSTVEN